MSCIQYDEDNFNEFEKIGDTDLTISWLLNCLRKNAKKYRQTYGYKNPIKTSTYNVSDGRGFFSKVLKVTLTFDENDEYSTIIKLPGLYLYQITDQKSKEEYLIKRDILAIPMHNNECSFYNKLSSLIPFLLPEIYDTEEWSPSKNQNGYILMENLTNTAKTINYYDTLNQEQIKCIVKNLAKFHSISMKNQDLWRNKSSKLDWIMKSIVKRMDFHIDNFKKFIKRKDLYQQVFNNEKFMKLIYNEDFIEYAYSQSYLDFGLPQLLVHGDVWGCNMLFEADKQGNATNKLKALIDWQVSHEGNFVIDFVRLFIISCDGHIRREAEKYIFDFYMECLRNELGNDEKITFTVEQLKNAYEWLFVAHSKHHFIVYPTIFKNRIVNPGEESIEEARKDICELRGIHIFEDVFRIINTGKFEKYL